MMMPPAKKNLATIILAHGLAEKPEAEMDTAKEGKLTAIDELMAAFKAGDKEAAATALQSFIDCCDEESETEEVPSTEE